MFDKYLPNNCMNWKVHYNIALLPTWIPNTTCNTIYLYIYYLKTEVLCSSILSKYQVNYFFYLFILQPFKCMLNNVILA